MLIGGLRNAQHFVRLQTQPPLRMVHAIAHREVCIHGALRPIHGLEIEVLEVEMLEAVRRESGLGEHQLQLVSVLECLRPDEDGADRRKLVKGFRVEELASVLGGELKYPAGEVVSDRVAKNARLGLFD